jgi:hypothetical protein
MERPLVWLGVAVIAMGLLLVGLGLLAGHLGKGGRLLPGDIVISRPGFTFAFPIVTSIVLSIMLTLVLWIVAAMRR